MLDASRFGNRWNQNLTGGTGNPSHLLFDANNHLQASSGYTYDAAGNLTYDKSHNYFYDAENRLIQVDGSPGYCSSKTGTVATACYIYDALDHRVQRTGVTLTSCDSTGIREYVYDLSDRWIFQASSTGAACNYEIYAGSRHLGSYNDNGLTRFSHSDWLGTERVRVNYGSGANRTYDQLCTSLPFGDALAGNYCVGYYSSTMHFTGKERDYESGLDDFGARHYTSSMGRFMMPDWAARPTAVPYMVAGDPQSLNLYGYVRDDPVSRIDADGHISSEAICQDLATMCNPFAQSQPQNKEKSKTPTAQKLKFKTLKGGPHSKTWVGQWELSDKSKKGGWIVQTIVNLDAAGKQTQAQFWEAWEVKPNSQYTKYYPDPEDDTFSGFPSGHKAQAEARFYEGLTLPSSFKANNPDTPSGMLPSTTVNPNLPTANATAPVNRVWDVP